MKVKAIRLSVDFYDLNEEFTNTQQVIDQLENQRFGFFQVRRAVRRDVEDWTDEHPLNTINNAKYRELSDRHFERGLVVYEGQEP
jgi:hypothetical protein